jgi:hypothetical protein
MALRVALALLRKAACGRSGHKILGRPEHPQSVSALGSLTCLAVQKACLRSLDLMQRGEIHREKRQVGLPVFCTEMRRWL